MRTAILRLVTISAVLAIGVLAEACSSTQDAPTQRAIDARVEYVRTRYMRGLDEWVTIHKSPWELRATRPSGEELALSTLLQLDREALRQRYGALWSDFAATVDAADPETPLPVAVHYKLSVPWRTVTPRLSSKDHAERVAAQREVVQAITEQSPAIMAELARAGVKDLSTVSAMPIVFGLAAPPTIRTLAFHPHVTLITSNEKGTGHTNAGTPKNSVTDTHADTKFNALGIYGDNQKVGVVEQDCGVFDSHEALSQNPLSASGAHVTYQAEPLDCTTDTDCLIACGGALSGETWRCINLGHPGHAG